jgi:hypothetical protein
MTKKLWSIFSILLIASLLLVACGNAGNNDVANNDVVEDNTADNDMANNDTEEADNDVEANDNDADDTTEEDEVEPIATLRIWADDTPRQSCSISQMTSSRSTMWNSWSKTWALCKTSAPR